MRPNHIAAQSDVTSAFLFPNRDVNLHLSSAIPASHLPTSPFAIHRSYLSCLNHLSSYQPHLYKLTNHQHSNSQLASEPTSKLNNVHWSYANTTPHFPSGAGQDHSGCPALCAAGFTGTIRYCLSDACCFVSFLIDRRPTARREPEGGRL